MGALSYVWTVRDSAAVALRDVGDPHRSALLLRLMYAAMDVNRAFVPQ